MRPHIARSLSALLLAAASSPAQELLWNRTGVYDSYALGEWIGVVGDLDGDGWEDVVNLGRSVDPNGWSQLFFLSGRDGSILRVRPCSLTPTSGCWKVATAGDMDSDGVPDYAVMLWDSRAQRKTLEIASARDDRVIWRFHHPWEGAFGYALAGRVDLNGDRRPDIIVSDDRALSSRGVVYAFSHAGALLYTFSATPDLAIGRSLARMDDVDGDGCDDFIVGGFGPDTNGRALLVSGRTGTFLRAGMGEPYDSSGRSVAGCGDVDGDGVPDFAAGNSDFGTARGVVHVFSGATAQRIYTFTGGPPQANAFGWEVAGDIDVDQDGVRDIVVTAPGELVPGGVGAVHVFSGRDGSEIYRDGAGNQDGVFLTTTRSPDSSIFPLFLTCAPFYGNGGWRLTTLGRIRCYRGSPPGVSSFGTPGAGTLRTNPRIGIRDLGPAGVRLHVSGAEPGQPVCLMVGLSRTTWAGHPLPLPLTVPGTYLLVSPDAFFWKRAGTSGLARGYASQDIPLPLAGPPGTVRLHGQWLCLGSGSTAPGGVTDAVTWVH